MLRTAVRTVTLNVKNNGTRAASDVEELYLAFSQAGGEAPKQLKAFQKVTLGAGAEQRVPARTIRCLIAYG